MASIEVCHDIVSAGWWNDHSFTLGEEVTINGEFITVAPVECGCSGVKANIDMALTQRSNLISVLVLDGRQLRASATSISLPGWYVMTRSYCCRWRSILWRCAAATMRFFRLIILRGLWSICTMNVLPYRYVWNFSQPYTMAKSSLSILNVGTVGLSVHEGLACKSNGLSILDDADSWPLECGITLEGDRFAQIIVS